LRSYFTKIAEIKPTIEVAKNIAKHYIAPTSLATNVAPIP
jgi:hypothetical protein